MGWIMDGIAENLNLKAESGGSVTSTSNDFIGVDFENVKTYISTIVATAIKNTVIKIREHDKVFDALETGWSGQSLKNFEENFMKAEDALSKSLNNAYAALLQEIVGIVNGMVEQDRNMVQKFE